MISVNLYKIIISVVLIACCVYMVKQFFNIKVLKFVINLSNEYGIVPEVIKEVISQSENADEIYKTLDKIVVSFEENIIEKAEETETEIETEITKNKIGFDIYG